MITEQYSSQLIQQLTGRVVTSIEPYFRTIDGALTIDKIKGVYYVLRVTPVLKDTVTNPPDIASLSMSFTEQAQTPTSTSVLYTGVVALTYNVNMPDGLGGILVTSFTDIKNITSSPCVLVGDNIVTAGNHRFIVTGFKLYS